jgi:hypothetical protein
MNLKTPIHRTPHKRIEGELQKFCINTRRHNGKSPRAYPVAILKPTAKNYTVLWSCGCKEDYNTEEGRWPSIFELQQKWGVAPSLKVTCPYGTHDFGNGEGSIYRARRTDSFRGLVQGGKSWDSSYPPYIANIKIVEGGYLDTTWGHWVFFKLGYQWYKFNLRDPLEPDKITVSGIMAIVKSIMDKKGYSYFISSGSRTSRQVTGNNDYWQWVFTIVYKKDEEEEIDGGITTLKDLRARLKEYNINDIVYIDINVEHMAKECSGTSHKGERVDLHGHEETIDYINISGKKYGDLDE